MHDDENKQGDKAHMEQNKKRGDGGSQWPSSLVPALPPPCTGTTATMDAAAGREGLEVTITDVVATDTSTPTGVDVNRGVGTNQSVGGLAVATTTAAN